MSNIYENSSNAMSAFTNLFPSFSNLNDQRVVQVTTPKLPSEVKWPELVNYQSTNNCNNPEKDALFSFSHFPDERDDPKAYLHKPVEKWTYADVMIFLMEACKELSINSGEVMFENFDNGSVLLQMTLDDFELLAPSCGKKLYDYFINFKSQHNIPPGQNTQTPYYNYNYKEGETPYPPLEQGHLSYQQHPLPQDIYPPHHYQQENIIQDIPHPLEHFHPNSYNSSGKLDSPLNEYVPQGSCYKEMSDLISREDIPSPALDSFCSTYDYDLPISDPGHIYMKEKYYSQTPDFHIYTHDRLLN